MIYLTAETRIKLAVAPVDFRKQIDGLAALCQSILDEQANTGTLFVFINRAKTMIRVLGYKDNGYWLTSRRLSRGRFIHWPKSLDTMTAIDSTQLMRMLKNTLALACPAR